MSQGLRELLANRRFAIPLLVLLAFCFVGLLLIGIILIWKPGLPTKGGTVAQATATPPPPVTSTQPLPPTFTPTHSPTPKPSPTLVPVGPTVGGATPTATTETTVPASEEIAPTSSAPAPTSTTPPGAQETTAEDEELAQTGVGWGLILTSGTGLALLTFVARRLRLMS